MKKMLFLITILLLAQGCRPNHKCAKELWKKLPLKVCTTETLQDTTIDAFNENAGFDFLMKWGAGFDCDVTIEVVADIPDGDFEGYTSLGCSEDGYIDSASIQLLPDYGMNLLAHEFGHALGHYDHVNKGLMSPRITNDFLEDLFKGEFIEWLMTTYPEQYN